ncbi:MAG: hypothetical protein HIU93_13860 [Acidobacteria bacterium]|nr:hypothetical protein [Acidobacteriota bacterium]MBW4046321.1 hypothetical protein [Acidobacteriota bacterium]
MKSLVLLVVLFLPLCWLPQAGAQPRSAGSRHNLSVFGEFSASRPGQGSGFVYGPTAGAYMQTSRHLGLTARGSILREGSAIHVYQGLLGPRISAHLPRFTLYGEGLGGLGHAGYQVPTPTGNGIASGWGLAWQLDAGLDHHILPHTDWRVVELAYGKVYTSRTVTSTTISTGLVIHLF